MTKRRPMAEEEWLASEQPGLMLQFLQQHRLVTRAPGGRRRLRLFACACCRSVWKHLDESDRRAVEISEDYADGRAGRRELEAVREEAEAAESGARQQLSEARRRHG